eukprot:7526125-Alexandrium_andersonii.AAC.1
MGPQVYAFFLESSTLVDVCIHWPDHGLAECRSINIASARVRKPMSSTPPASARKMARNPSDGSDVVYRAAPNAQRLMPKTLLASLILLKICRMQF